jgi:hypothetical protein
VIFDVLKGIFYQVNVDIESEGKLVCVWLLYAVWLYTIVRFVPNEPLRYTVAFHSVILA